MRLHRICGVRFRSHLRSYARAYAYRGLTAFASLSMAVSDGTFSILSFPAILYELALFFTDYL
ncbi:MAG: hypothetical protein ABW087_08135 [Candidatus Thiodiazotropha sp.]